MKKKATSKLSITIGHLYADLMNIYGDNGNIITLKKRLEWREIECKVVNITTKEPLKPGVVDLYFFGGGQDGAQNVVAEDLSSELKAPAIKKDIERGVPLLSICGGYQLLGDYYQPHEGPKLPGISVFPAYTMASYDRMIGNIVVEVSSELASQRISKSAEQKKQLDAAASSLVRQFADSLTLVGFENHSGKTYLKSGAIPLGKVITGFGNNGEDQTEGCIYKNAIGCYMHGSLLPKNPKLADWLIQKALEIKYGKEIELKALNDELETKAHDFAIGKFSK